jgi:hypothetical protein
VKRSPFGVWRLAARGLAPRMDRTYGTYGVGRDELLLVRLCHITYEQELVLPLTSTQKAAGSLDGG